MDFATLAAASRSWIESDPAFLQIVRGYFDDSVYLNWDVLIETSGGWSARVDHTGDLC